MLKKLMYKDRGDLTFYDSTRKEPFRQSSSP